MYKFIFNLLNAQLNPICHLLALLGAHHILHISRIRVNYVLFMNMKFIFKSQRHLSNFECDQSSWKICDSWS